MSGSPFFARIKQQVLQLTAAVPEGRVCTYASMGAHLDVVPRHVAYILSQLDAEEQQTVPWHRVVGAEGRLGVTRRQADGKTQADLLREEGVPVTGGRIEPGFEQRLITAAELPSGLPPQQRPADAPGPGPRPRRGGRRRLPT